MAALIKLPKIFKKENLDSLAPAAPNQTGVPQVRIVFMGTPKLSQELLQTLLDAGYNIVATVTKPDTKVGREQTLTPSAVKQLAESKNIPVLTPTKLDDTFYQELSQFQPDLILVAAYGKILPTRILDLPGLGCINVHYSLLPRFRGASPIQNALLFGDKETGVTLQKMDAGLDTGDIIAAQALPIDPDDTTSTLTPKLNATAQALLLKTLPLWIKQKITASPQNHAEAVLCQLIERADGKIEWTDTAQDIYNRFRAFDPWPGIFTYWKKDESFTRIKLINISLSQTPTTQSYDLGQVFQEGETLGVQTGLGVITLHSIQMEGKVKVDIQDFVRGNPDFIGGILV